MKDATYEYEPQTYTGVKVPGRLKLAIAIRLAKEGSGKCVYVVEFHCNEATPSVSTFPAEHCSHTYPSYFSFTVRVTYQTGPIVNACLPIYQDRLRRDLRASIVKP